MQQTISIFVLFIFLTIDGISQASTIDAKLLQGDQPELLIAMASSQATLEELSGSSMNIGEIVGGWHAQAVGQYKDFIYVAFSNGDPTAGKISNSKSGKYPSKLWIYNTKTKQGTMKELEEGYAHPCSIQITGKYLTIALEAEYGLSQAALGNERDSRSLALVFDLEKDPNCNIEVGRIAQDNFNSGGAGLTYSPAMKCWYMLVDQDGDNGGVALYKSKSEALDTWDSTPIARYRRFGSGAGVNLITASDQSIWGLYFDVAEDLPDLSAFEISGDKVFLFKLIDANGVPVADRIVYSQVVNIGAPRLKQAGELLANRPGMRFGASLRNENGKLEVLTCQRNMADKFYISRTPLVFKPQSQIFFVNLARTKGQIKGTSMSDASQTFSYQGLQTQSSMKVLPLPVKCDLSYLKVSTSSFRSLSAPSWSESGTFQTKAPLTLLYLEGTSSVSGNMREFLPKKFQDKMLK